MMYMFCLVCVSVQVPKTDNFITTSHFAFTFGGWTHSGMSVCPSGPGSLSGAFCPFNGLGSTPNHFQTLPGHAGHHVDQFLSPPLPSGLCEGLDRHCLGRARVSIGFIAPPLPAYPASEMWVWYSLRKILRFLDMHFREHVAYDSSA